MMRLAIGLALVVVALTAVIYGFMQTARFGDFPDGKRLGTVEQSVHYKNGAFRNLIPTPLRTGESGGVSNFASYLTDRNPQLKPPSAIPFEKVDLKALDLGQDLVIWLGHSSFFVQLAGRRMLIDPVFSLDAAPVPWVNRAFEGSTPYTANDMPALDYLLITHDHWDHLDYPSIQALRPKVRYVIAGLGVGSHLSRWGYPDAMIREGDWNSRLELDPGVRIHLLPARHFSGRGLIRDKTLWVSYALESVHHKLFFSGDSGYGPHFRQIGDAFDGFDLVALDTGQYDLRWANVHMFPEQTAQAAVDLQAKALLPGHIGRFSIAAHAWNDPFRRIEAASARLPYQLLTPIIGQPVPIGEPDLAYGRWWEGMTPSSVTPSG